jgi:adenosylhomocysteine nucleosidase
VAARNHIPCLILRGVTDLVDEHNGEAYGNVAVFHDSAKQIMTRLLEQLPAWLNG